MTVEGAASAQKAVGGGEGGGTWRKLCPRRSFNGCRCCSPGKRPPGWATGGGVERDQATGSEMGLVGMDLESKGLVWRRETEALSGEAMGFRGTIGL